MDLRPIIGILLARWRVVALSTLSCLAGGLTIMVVSDPAYRATARVTVDFLRPDPETGVVVGGKEVEAFVMSQLAMIRDQQIAGPAAEALGWLDSPDVQLAYAARPPSDQRDFRTWTADRIVLGTAARQVPESNILEISYRAATPELAKAVVEALRQSYIDASISVRRQQAALAADRLTERADRLKTQLAAAERRKNFVQDQTGVFFKEGDTDLENVRLGAMARTAQEPVMVPVRRSDAASIERRLVDVQAALAGAKLGPNHPARRQLEQQKAMLKAELAREELLATSAGAAVQAMASAKNAALAAQTSKVISRRQDVLKAQTAKDEVDLLHRRLVATLKNIANLRQTAASTGGPVAANGPVIVSPRPVFPNPILILCGTGVLGVLVGSLVALLTEFSDRRIRDVGTLAVAARAPVIGKFPAHQPPRHSASSLAIATVHRIGRRRRRGGRRKVEAA